MKSLKLSFVTITLLLFSFARAQDPDTGSFPVEGSKSQPDGMVRKDQKESTQLEQQKEEVRRDSFGEDMYNQNVDPESFKVDEAKKVQQILE